jgi:hypothetical protein
VGHSSIDLCGCAVSRLPDISGTSVPERGRLRKFLVSSQRQLDPLGPGDGFYYDRDFSGRFTGVKAVSGFLPLLLDDIPLSHVDRLAAHLDDPTTFAAPFPVPSVALDHPTWSTDMWRGATWINMNYLIVIGLRKHGRLAEADRLAQATVNHVDKYYQQFGVIFEFYDARGIIPPTQCHRKGPVPQRYDVRVKMGSIRDYHWTAALVASLLLDELGYFSTTCNATVSN